MQGAFLTWLFAFAFQISFSEKNNFCAKPREFRLVNADQVLSDHVIASYMTRSSGECFLYCAMNQECRSFNDEFASNPPGMLGIFVKSTMQH